MFTNESNFYWNKLEKYYQPETWEYLTISRILESRQSFRDQEV